MRRISSTAKFLLATTKVLLATAKFLLATAKFLLATTKVLLASASSLAVSFGSRQPFSCGSPKWQAHHLLVFPGHARCHEQALPCDEQQQSHMDQRDGTQQYRTGMIKSSTN